MSSEIKTIPFLDQSDLPKITVTSVPPDLPDDPLLGIGRTVFVQTKRTRELEFYVALQVVEQRDTKWVGKVIGDEGYLGPLDTIYPGQPLSFQFDNMAVDDLVWFDEQHVAIIT